MATVMASKADHQIRSQHCLGALKHNTLSCMYVEIHTQDKEESRV